MHRPVCPWCGFPVTPPVPGGPPAFCGNPACRKELPPIAAGPPRAAPYPPVAPRALPVAPRVATPLPPPPPPTYFDDSPTDTSAPSPPPSRRRKGTLLVAIVALFGLSVHAALGWVGYQLLFEKKKPEDVAATIADAVSTAPPTTAPAPSDEAAPGPPPDEPIRPRVPAGPAGDGAPLSAEQVYQQLLKSAALILTPGGGAGSGAVIDADRRLVVTNAHVVERNRMALVLFPTYDPAGEVVTSTRYYVQRAEQLGVRGRVVAASPAKDLALLELDALPAGVVAVPFADRPARTGSAVFSVGGSGLSNDLLWRLTTGVVRGRRQSGGAGGLNAMLLETNAAVNPGDSGGPVVNDRGRLVGVVAHFLVNQREVSGNIDVTEAREFVAGYARSNGWQWADAPPVPAAPIGPGRDPAPNPSSGVTLHIARLQAGTPADKLDAAKKLTEMGTAAQAAVPALVRAAAGGPPALQTAVADALDAIGPPAKPDANVFAAGLAASDLRVKLYSARGFATVAPPADALPALVALASDPNPALRDAAIRAIGSAGPSTRRPGTLAKLVAGLSDREPEVIDSAVAVLSRDDWKKAMTPDDLPELRPGLAAAKALARAVTAGLAVAAVGDDKTAATTFRPLLSDLDPRVRAEAVAGVLKWPDAATVCRDELLSLCKDDTPAVRKATVAALAKVGAKPGVSAALLAVAKTDDDPAVKAAAARALARIPLTGNGDLDALRFLLAGDDPDTLADSLEQLAAHGKSGAAAGERVVELARTGPPAVRPAAVDALIALGTDVRGAADALYDVAAQPKPSRGDDPRPKALDALPAFGPDGVRLLTKYLEKGADDLKPAAVKALGAAGPAARPAGPVLVKLGETATEMREPVAAALAKVGGDGAAAELRALLKWGAGGFDAATRSWAVETLGGIDPAGLSAAERETVYKRLFGTWGYDPIKSVREKAETAMKPFKPAGK